MYAKYFALCSLKYWEQYFCKLIGMNEGVKAQINDGQIRCVTTQRTAAKEIKVRRQDKKFFFLSWRTWIFVLPLATYMLDAITQPV